MARRCMRAPGLLFLFLAFLPMLLLAYAMSLPGGDITWTVLSLLWLLTMGAIWAVRLVIAAILTWRYRPRERVLTQFGWSLSLVLLVGGPMLSSGIAWLKVRLSLHRAQLAAVEEVVRSNPDAADSVSTIRRQIRERSLTFAGLSVGAVTRLGSTEADASFKSLIQEVADAPGTTPNLEPLHQSRGIVIWRADYHVFGDRYGLAHVPEPAAQAILRSHAEELGDGWFVVHAFRTDS